MLMFPLSAFNSRRVEAPFPMSARKSIPVADKLDDRMTRHRFALHLADNTAS
jgi:hypothetical protein